MRFSSLEYLSPRNVKGILKVLSEHGREVAILAGGTDLLVKMKHRLIRPRLVVDLGMVDKLRYVKWDKKGLRIGAGTKLYEIIQSDTIKAKFPSLSQAASSVASPQIRNMGTVGGNICLDTRCWFYNQSHWWRKAIEPCFKVGGNVCHVARGGDKCWALFMADTPPAFLALDANVKIASKSGERIIPLSQFYTGKGKSPNVLKQDELVTELIVSKNGYKSSYVRFSFREAIDFPVIGVSVSLLLEDGAIRDCRIVFTGVGSSPVRASATEEILKGKGVEEAVIEKAAKEASSEIRPISHMEIPALYKRRLGGAMVKKAIKKALEEVEE